MNINGKTNDLEEKSNLNEPNYYINDNYLSFTELKKELTRDDLKGMDENYYETSKSKEKFMLNIDSDYNRIKYCTNIEESTISIFKELIENKDKTKIKDVRINSNKGFLSHTSDVSGILSIRSIPTTTSLSVIQKISQKTTFNNRFIEDAGIVDFSTSSFFNCISIMSGYKPIKEFLYLLYDCKVLYQKFFQLLINEVIIIKNMKYIKKKYIKEKKLLLYKAYNIFEVFDFMLEIIKKKERLKIFYQNNFIIYII